jgi:Bacterial protein of unknown function (DUF922)
MPTRYDGPHFTTYTVSGTLAEVADTIEAREEAGQCIWHPDLSWASDGNGTIARADVTCTITIELPEWDGYASAPKPDRDAWDAFLTALRHHEDGHVQIVHEWFASSDDWLIGQTEGTVEDALAQLNARAQFHSDEFDALTDHGINRGCVIVVGSPGADEAAEEETAEDG